MARMEFMRGKLNKFFGFKVQLEEALENLDNRIDVLEQNGGGTGSNETILRGSFRIGSIPTTTLIMESTNTQAMGYNIPVEGLLESDIIVYSFSPVVDGIMLTALAVEAHDGFIKLGSWVTNFDAYASTEEGLGIIFNWIVVRA
jgi:hypothetical protein